MKKSIEYYDAIYSWKDYFFESERISHWIDKYVPDAKNLLELACGTGQHISHLHKYSCTGIDLCEDSLVLARERAPHGQFICSDMATFSSRDTFDVIVSMFGGVSYLEPRQLKSAIRLWKDLLSKRGLLIIEPWLEEHAIDFQKPNFLHVDTDHGEIVRMVTPKREGQKCVLEFAFLGYEQGQIVSFEQRDCLFMLEHHELKEYFSTEGFKVVEECEGFLAGSTVWMLMKSS